MNIKLTPATAKDTPAYIRIGTLTASRFNHTTTDPAEAAKEIAESTTHMIIADEQIVGYIGYTKRGNFEAHISEVQVEPKFQGKGIGGAVLQMILKKLAEEHITLVDLFTHPESHAKRLYERCGFIKTGDIVQNYRNTGEPRIRMAIHPAFRS